MKPIRCVCLAIDRSLKSNKKEKGYDPVTGVSVTFPDLNSPPFGGEEFQANLIMPEPCPFLNRSLPIVLIIRPTKTNGVAMGALTFLTNMGLFIGQSQAFFDYMTQLAQDADAAVRGC